MLLLKRQRQNRQPRSSTAKPPTAIPTTTDVVSPDPEEEGVGGEAEAGVALPGAGSAAAFGDTGAGGVPGGAGESVEGGAGAVGGAPVGVEGVGEEELDGADGGGGGAAVGEAVPLGGAPGGEVAGGGGVDIAAGPARASSLHALVSYSYGARRASGALLAFLVAGGDGWGGELGGLRLRLRLRLLAGSDGKECDPCRAGPREEKGIVGVGALARLHLLPASVWMGRRRE